MVARGQLLTVDPGFPEGAGPDSFIRVLARQADGRLLVAGPFTNWSGVSQPRLARLTTNGLLDPSFTPVVDSDPRSVVPLADGRIVVTGPFTNVGGTFRPGLARLNRDGSLDSGFNPPPVAPASALYGGGFVTTSGGVLVAGTFTNLGGLPRNRLARLLAEGSVDPAFLSPFTPTNTISIVALQPDDKVLLAGNFLSVAGTPRNGLVRLNPDGSVDPSFQPDIGPSNRVSRAIVQPDGRLVAAVYATFDTGFPIGPQRLIRLNGDGSLDSGFNVQFSFPGFPYNGVISGLAVQTDGKIIVSGKFLRVNGTPRAAVARLQPGGTLDYCFELGLASEALTLAVETSSDGSVLIGGLLGSIQGQLRPYLARLIPPAGCDPGVIELAVPTILTRDDAPRVVVPVVRRGGADREQTVAFATREGTAIAGQDYDAVAGTLRFVPGERSQSISVPLPGNIASGGGRSFEVILNAPGGGADLGGLTNTIVTISDAPPGTAGSPDTNFVVQLDAPVLAVLPLSDGRIVIGGSFTNVNGQPSPSLARLLANGSRDPGFVRSLPLDGDVLALATNSSGGLLVGGRFRQVDGVWRPGLARFNSDGSPDSLFAPFASWATNLAGYSVEIEHLIALTDGSIVCGGLVPFGDYGSDGVLLKVSPSGDVDAAFTDRIPAATQVGALAAFAGGDFLFGGTGLGNSVVRLRPDGVVNLAFNPPPDRQASSYTLQLGLLPDQRIVVAGFPDSFVGLPGQPLLWRFNPDGSFDPTLLVTNGSPDLGGIYYLDKLSVAADGRMLIVGEVSASGGSSLKCLRLHADGSRDSSFDQGGGPHGSAANATPTITALAALPGGGWLMSGDFAGYDGFNQGYLVKILPETLARPLEFQFAITNLTTAETNGAETLEIIRRGDASGSASATVRTEDGSATAGLDYVPVDTTVDFAPGEWSKTVPLAILNDSLVEGWEQFVVRLTNATAGFGVGGPSAVTVQINSDDAGVEFIADSFHGIEEDGFVLAGVRWTNAASSGPKVTINIVPETGSTNDLVATSVTVLRSGVPYGGNTNWFRIGLVDDALHQATRQFRLELVPGSNVVVGPESLATLVIDDLDFATAPSRGVAGVIEAIANSPDGGVYLGGDFTGVHGVPRNRVARLHPDGAVDTAFDPGVGPDANVSVLAVQVDGKLLIAGDFTMVDGVPRVRAARLNSDGTLDETFDPGAGPSSTNGIVFIRSLVAQEDGGVLIGGAFSHFAGQPRGLVARLVSDGSLDSAFTSPFLGPTTVVKFPPTGASAIQTLATTPEGRILAAGYWAGSSSVAVPLQSPASVMGLTAIGKRDPGFAGIVVNSLDRIAWSMARVADGRILVGGTGQFGSGWTGRSTIETNWVAIRRFDTNGVLDPGFHVTNAPPIAFYSSEIRQILVQPDGRILFVAAIFVRTSTPVEALDHAVVGRLLPNGVWDGSFDRVTCGIPLVRQTGPFWFNAPSHQFLVQSPPPVPTVFLSRQPNGILNLAGAFDDVNGVPRRRLARLDPEGVVRGALQLGISPPNPVQLYVPPEVEMPYVIDYSPDLQSWSPWRTNTAPWREWRESVAAGEPGGFFRARSAE